jgi:hypothetical protein
MFGDRNGTGAMASKTVTTSEIKIHATPGAR